jgi:hypothetical protein
MTIKPSIDEMKAGLEPGKWNPEHDLMFDRFLALYPGEMVIMGRLVKMGRSKVKPESFNHYQTSLTHCDCLYFQKLAEDDCNGLKICKHVLDVAFSSCLWDYEGYLRNRVLEGNQELNRIALVTLIDTTRYQWRKFIK